MYTEISITNFRGLKKVRISDFQKINLFVGKNNSGKTSILESLFLITGFTNVQLPININQFRGLSEINENSWSWIFNGLDINTSIEISALLKYSAKKRCLKISPSTTKATSNRLVTKATISREDLESTESNAEQSSRVDGLILESTFWEKKKQTEQIVSKIMTKEGGFEIARPTNYKENLRGIYMAAKAVSGNISERFNNIQIQKRIPSIVKILQQIEPSLKNLALGTNGIVYGDIGLAKLIPINCMGNGIMQLLSIILNIADSSSNMIFVDEIENGFHYNSQKILWNAIFEAVTEFDVQIFATTHSMDCVKALGFCCQSKDDDIRLYRLEKKKNSINVVQYDRKILQASLESEWEVR